MRNTPALATIVTLEWFNRAAKGLLTEEDRAAIEIMLATDPHAGTLIPGTGGFRKIRYARDGEGKSGGVRVIYFYPDAIGRIYLMTVYAKNRVENISQAERNQLKAIAKALNGE